MEPAARPDEVQAARRRFRRTLLIFALVGPYIGLGLALIAMTIAGIAGGQGVPGTLAAVLALGIVSAVFAIPVGGLPGLLTGFVAAALLRRNTEPARYYALTACVGALAALAIPLAIHAPVEIWAVVGLGAALICARIARGR